MGEWLEMAVLVNAPKQEGTSYLTCSEGHSFGLPMIYLEDTIFLHYFRSSRIRLACPVCWTGGRKCQPYERMGMKPEKVTLLPLGTQVDWVHRGQHYDCVSCEYVRRTGR